MPSTPLLRCSDVEPEQHHALISNHLGYGPKHMRRYPKDRFSRGAAWDETKDCESDVPQSHWRKDHTEFYWAYYTVRECSHGPCRVCRPGVNGPVAVPALSAEEVRELCRLDLLMED